MTLVPVDSRTRFTCTECGKCCKGYILSKKVDLSIMENGIVRCKHLSNKNLCTIYDDKTRPFICHMFPFFPDIEKIKEMKEKGLPPKNLFSPENLLIHTECDGFGKGKRVVANNQILKELKKNEEVFVARVLQGIESKESYEELF
jgi:Fe-S-cluster containining protein